MQGLSIALFAERHTNGNDLFNLQFNPDASRRSTWTLGIVKMRRLTSLLLLLSIAVPCIADTYTLPFFSISTPSGWHVDDLSRPGSGSIFVARNRDEPAPQLIVNYCQWNDIGGCRREDCRVESVRENIWTPIPNVEPIVAQNLSTLKEYRYTEEVARAGIPFWVNASYTCTSNGVVFVLAISMVSKSEAIDLVNSAVSSIQWSKPLLDIETTTEISSTKAK